MQWRRNRNSLKIAGKAALEEEETAGAEEAVEEEAAVVEVIAKAKQVAE